MGARLVGLLALALASPLGLAGESDDSPIMVDLGWLATGVALDAVHDRVYVAVSGSNDVAVLDGVGTILGHLSVPGPYSVAADPTRNLVYATSLASWDVWALDPSTGDTLWRSPLGVMPYYMAFAPASGLLYVTAAGGNLAVVDTLAGMVLHVSPLGVGELWGVSVDPVTQVVFAASCGGVRVIDPLGVSVLSTLQRDRCYYDVAVHAPTHLVYAVGGSLDVLDPVVGFDVGLPRRGGYTVAADPLSTMAFVGAFLPHCTWWGDYVLGLDWLSEGEWSLTVSSCALDVAVDPLQRRLYVAGYDGTLTIASTPV